MRAKLKWLLAVAVVVSGGFYAYSLRVTGPVHIPGDLRDAVADGAMEQLLDGREAGGISVPEARLPKVVFSEVKYALPVKLAVTAAPASVKAASKSQWITIRIALQDSANRPARIGKDMEIELEARTEAEVLGTTRAVVKAMSTSTEVLVKVNMTGVIYLSAKNPELLEGGAYIVSK